MFASFMINTWAVATIVAPVAGVVGFFVVLRGSAFPAHAIPKGAFAGAAGAALLGISTLLGLAVFSLLGALGIGFLGRRARQDVATALALVMMLALGAAFLSRTTEYEPEIYSLLFGEVLGVSTTHCSRSPPSAPPASPPSLSSTGRFRFRRPCRKSPRPAGSPAATSRSAS